MDETPLPQLRSTPRYGRTAIITMLALGVLFFSLVAMPPLGGFSTVAS